MSGNAWPSPGRSLPATGTAGTGHGPVSPARLVSQAGEAARAGHRVSARGAYLRAAEYFRQAFFFHREDLDGGELQSAAIASSVLAFRAALGHLGHPGRVLLRREVPGYLFTPGPASGRHPVILHIGGYDGTAEELYASVPAGSGTRLCLRRAGRPGPGGDAV